MARPREFSSRLATEENAISIPVGERGHGSSFIARGIANGKQRGGREGERKREREKGRRRISLERNFKSGGVGKWGRGSWRGRRSRSRSLRRASIMTVPREIARRRAWSESERECATCYTGSDLSSAPPSLPRHGMGGVNEHKVESSGSFALSWPPCHEGRRWEREEGGV